MLALQSSSDDDIDLNVVDLHCRSTSYFATQNNVPSFIKVDTASQHQLVLNLSILPHHSTDNTVL